MLTEPRQMAMCGEDLVRWKGDTIELVDTSGNVRWSATFAKRLTHVAAHGDTLVCLAGTLAVFCRVAALVRRPSAALRSHDRVG